MTLHVPGSRTLLWIGRVEPRETPPHATPHRRTRRRAGDERLIPAHRLIPALLKTCVDEVLKGRTAFRRAEEPVQESGGRASGRADRRSRARRAPYRTSHGARC